MKVVSPLGPTRTQWALPFVSMFVGFFFFLRDPSDLIATTQHGMLLLKVLFSGEFLNFYQLSIDNTIMPAMYGFLFYALFSLLLLPLAVIFRVFLGKFDYTDQFQIIISTRFMQVCLILLLCFTAYLIYRLALRLNYKEGNARWAAYLYLASPLTLFADAIFWQYDVITLVFLLAAMFYYVDEKYWHFSLFMSLAIACKLFAFFAFVPLILLVEKRVTKLCGYSALALLCTIVMELIAKFMPGYNVAKEMSGNIIDRVFYQSSVATMFGPISLTLILITGIVIYAYVYKPTSKLDLQFKALYLGFVGFAVPFLFFAANTYWWILPVPFLALLVAGHQRMQEILLLLSGFFIFLIVTSVLSFKFYMDQNMVNGGLLAKIFGVNYSGTPSFYTLAEKFGLNYPGGFYSFAIAMLIGVMVLLWKHTNHALFAEQMKSDFPSVHSGYIYFYNAALYFYILPSLLLFARELFLK